MKKQIAVPNLKEDSPVAARLSATIADNGIHYDHVVPLSLEMRHAPAIMVPESVLAIMDRDSACRQMAVALIAARTHFGETRRFPVDDTFYRHVESGEVVNYRDVWSIIQGYFPQISNDDLASLAKNLVAGFHRKVSTSE